MEGDSHEREMEGWMERERGKEREGGEKRERERIVIERKREEEREGEREVERGREGRRERGRDQIPCHSHRRPKHSTHCTVLPSPLTIKHDAPPTSRSALSASSCLRRSSRSALSAARR